MAEVPEGKARGIEELPAVDGGPEKAVVWPRKQDLAKLKDGTPTAGIFGDNPGYHSYTHDRPGIADGVAVGPNEPFPLKKGNSIKLEKGMVIALETDCIIVVICDVNQLPDGKYPERGSAEQVIAVIEWGFKLKVEIGSKWEENKGLVFPKPPKVICANDKDFDYLNARKDLDSSGVFLHSKNANVKFLKDEWIEELAVKK